MALHLYHSLILLLSPHFCLFLSLSSGVFLSSLLTIFLYSFPAHIALFFRLCLFLFPASILHLFFKKSFSTSNLYQVLYVLVLTNFFLHFIVISFFYSLSLLISRLDSGKLSFGFFSLSSLFSVMCF